MSTKTSRRIFSTYDSVGADVCRIRANTALVVQLLQEIVGVDDEEWSLLEREKGDPNNNRNPLKRLLT
jgi:hypothetical protein